MRFRANDTFNIIQMYANFSQPKGLCLVINNRSFSTMPERTGTDVDATNIERLFKKLGYSTKVKHNLKRDVRVQ